MSLMQETAIKIKFEIKFKKISKDEFLLDPSLKKQIHDLAAPSYVDPSAMIERDIRRCDRFYLAFDAENKLCASFMTGRGEIFIDDQLVPTLFLGLAITSVATQKSGIIMMLYQLCLEEAKIWEKQLKKRFIVWYTTATPLIFSSSKFILTDLEPSIEGSYTAEGQQIALALCKVNNWTANPQDHPFVLRKVAHNTLYSPAECLRIQKMCQDMNFTLFNDLGIDERQGDRLLRIARVPGK